MTEIHYVCTGSCQGVATQEEWEKGAKTCGAEECEKHGNPLDKRFYCKSCDEHYLPGDEHVCS